MNLNEALTDIAARLDLDAQELIEFSKLDNIGGWDYNAQLYGWEVGSLHSVEGKVLYALVRATKPLLCVEFGTWHGCSASHIAAALKANGNGGTLICVDHGGFGGVHIPNALLDYVEFKHMNLFDYLTVSPMPFDFIFEDADHTEDQVKAVWDSAAWHGLLAPNGIIVSHDAMHRTAGEAVQRGIKDAGVVSYDYLIEPADCGLAIFKLELKTLPDYSPPNDTVARANEVAATKPRRKAKVTK